MKFAGMSSLALGLALSGQLLAHPGSLDQNGCHHNRKTGDYHCHRSPQQTPERVPAPLKRGNDVYYVNCTAARAAGAAPIRYGEPGYARHLDRDGDGVACE
jgi:hypothetical protein